MQDNSVKQELAQASTILKTAARRLKTKKTKKKKIDKEKKGATKVSFNDLHSISFTLSIEIDSPTRLSSHGCLGFPGAEAGFSILITVSNFSQKLQLAIACFPRPPQGLHQFPIQSVTE